MKKSNIYFVNRNSLSVFMMLMLFSMVSIFSTSCNKEDDIPPPSAYVPPVIDTSECVFLIINPELSGDEALAFECEGPEYTIFGDIDAATLTISHIDNPAPGGINTSEKVVEVIQNAGVQPWAGFFFDLSTKIDFSTFQDIKVKVYSPAAGQIVNVKIEDSLDGSLSTETTAMTTVANEWEELCFPFSAGDSDKYDRFVLFFDFQGPKDAETIHYFDDIILGEGCMTGGGSGSSAVPTIAAPTPAVTADNVISLYSNAYNDVPVDTWLTVWSSGSLLDTMVQGDEVKKYSELGFVGIETIANQIDITTMTHFHTHIWTANATEVKVKIVDFGPDGAFDGGDDTEHEIIIENPTNEEWVSLDLPLADFTGLTTREHIAQFIYSAGPSGSTVFMDNIFFYDIAGLLTAPSVAAPTPTLDPGNVISLFSDAYTNVAVDTWQTVWSQADYEEVDIMGSATLKYSNLDFVGAEMVANQIDVTSMTHFHLDIWTPDAAQFRVKIVDFGPDGAFDGGDDTEHELAFENPAQGEWISLDLPLSDFVDLTTKEHIAQLIFAAGPAGVPTIFIDNVYFHN